MSDTKSRHFLNQKQFFQLGTWLQQNKDHIKGKRFAEIAALATSTLGFLVSENNLKTAIEAADLDIQQPKTRSAGAGVTDRVQILGIELEKLMLNLGYAVPESVHAIATRRGQPAGK